MGTPQGGRAAPPGPRPWCGPAPRLGGRDQDAGAWRLKEGGLLPSRDSRGVRVYVCLCVGGWVCAHTYACVCPCVYVCVRSVVTASQLGASCPRTPWTLEGRGAGPRPRQAWNEDPESTPLLRAPLTPPGWDAAGGHCRGHRDPLTGPPHAGTLVLQEPRAASARPGRTTSP